MPTLFDEMDAAESLFTTRSGLSFPYYNDLDGKIHEMHAFSFIWMFLYRENIENGVRFITVKTIPYNQFDYGDFRYPFSPSMTMDTVTFFKYTSYIVVEEQNLYKLGYRGYVSSNGEQGYTRFDKLVLQRPAMGMADLTLVLIQIMWSMYWNSAGNETSLIQVPFRDIARNGLKGAVAWVKAGRWTACFFTRLINILICLANNQFFVPLVTFKLSKL